MLDLRYVTENLDEVRAQIARRSDKYAPVLDEVAKLAVARRAALTELEQLRATRNEASTAMAKLDKKSPEFAEKRDALKISGDRVKELEAKDKALEAELEAVVLGVPNLPDASTPDGKDETANVVVKTWGDKPTFAFEPKDHADLGVALGILDFERAVKISGARFTVLLGAAARLERALLSFMMDVHANEHGYTEIWPPALVLPSAMRGTGQLPKFASDMFKTERTKLADTATEEERASNDLYLAPTAEVPVTNFHGDEIFEAGDLPRSYVAYTACFRAEAGSYGKDTKGLIRQHQFDKVELVRFCKAGEGPAQLDALRGHAERILEKLGLHYRTVQLCAGDMGFGAKKCFDLEVWLPGQNAYREISSCSWFGDFQARRAKIRYREEPKGKPQLAHTLNGSGLAIGRTLVAILEQYQQADGSVRVPDALRPYMGGLETITKA
ncbi:MAG: serine--tRNA ligase [Deltaproteobacteria bacterium]|nr:serine--tRNA ligase [Deltaproteobacteria bacterium]